MSSTTAPSATANVAAVEAIYAAFGRGDVPSILERLADDVRWDDWGDSFAQRAGVPVSTVHFYQAKGLIHGWRSEGGVVEPSGIEHRSGL